MSYSPISSSHINCHRSRKLRDKQGLRLGVTAPVFECQCNRFLAGYYSRYIVGLEARGKGDRRMLMLPNRQRLRSTSSETHTRSNTMKRAQSTGRMMILKFARSKVECSVFRGMMFSAAVETKRVLKAYMRRSHMHDLDEILRKFKVYDSRSGRRGREILHLFR